MKPDSDLLTIIREQESKLVFAEFDSSTAWALGSAVRDAFLASPAYIEQARSIVIAVELFSGLTLFRAAVGDGVSADNWEWVARKTNVVRRFGKSSFALGRELATAKKTVTEKYAVPEAQYATHGGAFPLRVKGHPAPIGCVVISGLAQDQDHQFAVSALEKILNVQVPGVL